jgi:energy-coupling factor transporter ATP-binding protein EcfA2
VIEVDQLVKRFGAVTAVDGLSFAVRPGHVTGFLGPNGAGKTTTMRVILGLDAATSGTARVNQKSYQELIRPLHQVGALLDATALHPGRTAEAHLASIAQSNGIGRARVTEMLRLTGLDSVANRRVKGFWHRPAAPVDRGIGGRRDVGLLQHAGALQLARRLDDPRRHQVPEYPPSALDPRIGPSTAAPSPPAPTWTAGPAWRRSPQQFLRWNPKSKM